METSLDLIRRVERKHSAAHNPWFEALLKHFSEIGGIWQEVRQDGRLVGCGLLVEDNDVMLLTGALGLADDAPYAYLLLLYGFVQQAISRGVKALRFGTGAYEAKLRLGSALETNNHTAVVARNPALRRLAKWLA